MIGVEEFVSTHSRSLLRAAWLLTGDWATAEDLVQTTLIATWRRWEAIDSPEIYVRRVLTNTYLSSRRRRWTGERPVADLPELPGPDAYGSSDTRHALTAALATLPAQQRAVVVLRYFLDLSEAQAAASLGCSVGNVKSQSSRALAKLRARPEVQSLLAEAFHG
ncbi:MAG TPA: SigE family RNA polymerase sigma factor [Jatrophihabitans sp.]|nr:SigE family RNA polymerase sigma factor [Jatrophihabitans sp.]